MDEVARGESRMRSLSGMMLRGIGLALLLSQFLFEAVSNGEETPQQNFFTMESSVDEALANNYQVKIRKERIGEANFAKDRAKADFFPKLSTTYGYTRYDKDQTTNPVPIAPGLLVPGRTILVEDNYLWTFSVRQPVFTGFSLLSTFRLAELGIDQSEMNLALEKLNLVFSVKEAYLGIIRADSAINIARREVEARESHLEVAKNFFEVGILPINDVLKVEVELANAQQNLVKAENAAKYARAIFNNRLARPVELAVQVEENLAYQPVRFNLQESLDLALKYRPEIKLTDISLLQAEQQIRLAKSAYYPQVNLAYDQIQPGDDWTVSGSALKDVNHIPHWQASAVLTWTFWEWGKTNNAVRERLSQKRQLEDAKASLTQDIGLQLTQAGLELSLTEQNIPTTKKAVEQAEENLRVNEERYRAQVTTTTEVLDAQSLLTQARVNYYNALIDHHLAKARLQRAVGEN
jgi:outer membrane protein